MDETVPQRLLNLSIFLSRRCKNFLGTINFVKNLGTVQLAEGGGGVM